VVDREEIDEANGNSLLLDLGCYRIAIGKGTVHHGLRGEEEYLQKD
jgi:hypothetical protein